MATLRRISIVTLNPEKLARFYQDVFGMRRIANERGDALYLSDGTFNLTLVPNRAEGKPNGLNHFGFQIEEDFPLQSFSEWGLSVPTTREGKRSFADLRGTDPDGNNFDLSYKGFPV